MLKMTLNEINGCIQIYPESWVNKSTTNCYAYALGLDIREGEICKSAYQPGTISGNGICPNFSEYFLYSKLIEGLESDLDSLRISYREIEPNDEVHSNEWKVALFAEFYEEEREELIFDFHFLRTNKNGHWTHKDGFDFAPTRKDYSNQIITDPKKCDLCSYQYKKCYALRLKER